MKPAVAGGISNLKRSELYYELCVFVIVVYGGLFNEAVSASYYIASNDGMINE
jgi:hypothetical protein